MQRRHYCLAAGPESIVSARRRDRPSNINKSGKVHTTAAAAARRTSVASSSFIPSSSKVGPVRHDGFREGHFGFSVVATKVAQLPGHQRSAKDVGQIFAVNAARPLHRRRKRKKRKEKETSNEHLITWPPFRYFGLCCAGGGSL